MLWVDGVGGYLLTLADEVTIGQPASDGDPAPSIGLLADLSRRHAKLARREGRYVLTPHGETTIDGRRIDGPTVVEDGASIGLGSARLRLRRPHALSATAVLTVESGHRTAPAADAVLLMAESCVVGPRPHSHVRCAGATDEVILFRGAGGLRCRASGPLVVDGVAHTGTVAVEPGLRMEGQDFALCVESVGEA